MRISDANWGNALFNSLNAAEASAEVLKFPTRVYQFGELENEYTWPLYLGNFATTAFPLAFARDSNECWL